ncbi:MAG TPA: hypothetical protein VHO70_20220 [Chitinispirillaceae bacterium]|nr:hypothetical protein [Chitinispirillaceae bacterium]
MAENVTELDQEWLFLNAIRQTLTLGNKTEVKNDEEFPGIIFGSIAGGSALKFGIFRKKETGEWTIRHPTAQETIVGARCHVHLRNVNEFTWGMPADRLMLIGILIFG